MKSFIITTLLDGDKFHSKKGNKEWFIKNDYEKEYIEIIQTTAYLSNPSFTQRLYHIVNDIDQLITCPNCNNIPQFISLKKGYRTYCSNKCQIEFTKEKRKQTIKDKYKINPLHSISTSEKRKQTNLEKYNSEYPFQNKSIQAKQKQSMLDLYGVKNPSQLEHVKKQKIKTSLNNWGTSHPIQNTTIKNKLKATSLEKYGREYFFQTTEFKEKIKDYVFPSQSKAETEIIEFLNQNGITNIEQGNRSLLNGKELDIYVKDKNIAIEYCGLYWHSNKFKDKSYHKEKFNACKEKNIQLITIFEDEWNTKKLLVKQKLLHLLNSNNTIKIYARKCEIKLVDTKEKTYFHGRYHIQGNGISSLNIGLYFNTELVSCMSFKVNKNKQFELTRYSTRYHVIGGFNKLLNHFKINYDWNEIVTFADLRWHLGNVYKISGFIEDKILDTDYSYIINNKRIHKFNFRKDQIKNKFPELYNENLSEAKNMENIGILKIYDCGKIRFKLTKE